MKSYLACLIVVGLLVPLAAGGFAQGTKGKTKTKSGTQKPAQKPGGSGLGTAQLPGDNGKVGTVYVIGDKGDELFFTLESATFALRAPTAEVNHCAEANRRLLILNVAVQNPQKVELDVNWSSFDFTVVSPDDENFKDIDRIYHPDRKNDYSGRLKPAQKVRYFAIVPVYEKGPIVKLMVQRGEGKVLRYDLRNVVKSTPETFLPAGGDALMAAEAKIGETVPFGMFDFTIEKVEDAAGPIGDQIADEGQRLIVVTAKVKNPFLAAQDVYFSTHAWSLTDENGEPVQYLVTYRMSAPETLSRTVPPGEEVRFRAIFNAPKDAKLKKLTITENQAERKLTIPLGN